MSVRFFVILFGIVLLMGDPGFNSPAFAQRPLQGTQDCNDAKERDWNDAERKVWASIVHGEKADLGVDFTPSDTRMSPEDMAARILRPSFLETILLDDTFAKKIKHRGVRITGALFQEDINLSHAVLQHDLQLEKCRFEKEVDLSGVISDHGISLAESFVGGELTLAGARINGSLVLDKGIFGKTSMVNIRVGGQISIKEAMFRSQPDSCTLSTNAKSPLTDERDTVFDLMSGEISGQFILDKTCFAGDVRMPGINVGCQMSAIGVGFGGNFVMPGAVIERQLNLKDAGIEGCVILAGARLTNRLVLENAKVKGKLELQGAHMSMLSLTNAEISGPATLEGVQIKGDLEMGSGYFKDLNLITAHVEGKLNAKATEFGGTIKAYGLKVDDLFLLEGAECSETLFLHRLFVQGNLDMRSGKFSGKVSLKGGRIEGDLYLDEAAFDDELDMERIGIGGTLILNKGEFNQKVIIKLSKIGSIEYKGTRHLQFLDLTGSSVNKLFVETKSRTEWPQEMDLHGFTYNLFVRGDIGNRAEEEVFFQDWLHQMKKYKPQPYVQCAKVLRDAGRPDRANAVLYAGKETERKMAWADNKTRWLWLLILKLTIGYGLGLRYFRSLAWAGSLLVVGSILCWKARTNDQVQKIKGEASELTWTHCFFYSLDMLLPLIKLRELNDTIDLPVLLRRYFYFHKLAGWLLASFILAGLAGITQ